MQVVMTMCETTHNAEDHAKAVNLALKAMEKREHEVNFDNHVTTKPYAKDRGEAVVLVTIITEA